jgi:hypothetical protein
MTLLSEEGPKKVRSSGAVLPENIERKVKKTGSGQGPVPALVGRGVHDDIVHLGRNGRPTPYLGSAEKMALAVSWEESDPGVAPVETEWRIVRLGGALAFEPGKNFGALPQRVPGADWEAGGRVKVVVVEPNRHTGGGAGA